MLGVGTYGTVRLCTRKGESTRFAVKVQSKTDVKAKHLLGEVSILRRVGRHPNIIMMHDVWETPIGVMIG